MCSICSLTRAHGLVVPCNSAWGGASASSSSHHWDCRALVHRHLPPSIFSPHLSGQLFDSHEIKPNLLSKHHGYKDGTQEWCNDVINQSFIPQHCSVPFMQEFEDVRVHPSRACSSQFKSDCCCTCFQRVANCVKVIHPYIGSCSYREHLLASGYNQGLTEKE